MSHLKAHRNSRVRKRREIIRLNDPALFESIKEKEKIRGRQRRLAKRNTNVISRPPTPPPPPPPSPLPSIHSSRSLLARLQLPMHYIERCEVDADIEMVCREQARSNWRQQLLPICPDTNSVGVSVALFANNNKIRLTSNHSGNRTKAFAEEKVLAAKLLDLIAETLMDARLALELIPYSTMMIEHPKDAIAELSRWSKIFAEAIEVHSRLETRMEAASFNMYWHANTHVTV